MKIAPCGRGSEKATSQGIRMNRRFTDGYEQLTSDAYSFQSRDRRERSRPVLQGNVHGPCGPPTIVKELQPPFEAALRAAFPRKPAESRLLAE
jgi:hypothetical protein